MAETTSSAGVAQRYATALFELADEAGALDAVETHVNALDAGLKESPELRSVVASPIYTREQQGAAMAAICRAMDIGPPTSNLVALMAAKRRLYTLDKVIASFRELLAKKRGIVSAEVRTAAPLSDAQRDELERVLREAIGSKISLDVTVDEALIGGLVVKVGSKMIDTSIRSRLNRLQTAMREVGV